jgi:20S proteasome subunit beta 7
MMNLCFSLYCYENFENIPSPCLLSLTDHMWDDGNSLGPKEIHSYLTRVMYNRRNKFDPLWNSLVLGGVKKGPKGEEKYLGMVHSS